MDEEMDIGLKNEVAQGNKITPLDSEVSYKYSPDHQEIQLMRNFINPDETYIVVADGSTRLN